MGCECGCEQSEEELLVYLAKRRQKIEINRQTLSPVERQQTQEHYQKNLDHVNGLIAQVQSRLDERLALLREAEQPAT